MAEAQNEAQRQEEKGEMEGAVNLLYATLFDPGKGGEYGEASNEVLRLPVED